MDKWVKRRLGMFCCANLSLSIQWDHKFSFHAPASCWVSSFLFSKPPLLISPHASSSFFFAESCMFSLVFTLFYLPSVIQKSRQSVNSFIHLFSWDLFKSDDERVVRINRSSRISEKSSENRHQHQIGYHHHPTQKEDEDEYLCRLWSAHLWEVSTSSSG